MLRKEHDSFIHEHIPSFARSQGLQHTAGKNSSQQTDKMIKTTRSGEAQDPFSAAQAGSTVLPSVSWGAASSTPPASAAVSAFALALKTCKFQKNHKPGIHPKGIWGNTPQQLSQPLGYNLALKQSYLLLHFMAEVHNAS